MLQEVPEQHKGAWANAWTEVLRKVNDAETDEDKDRALLWLSFLSQGLLRKPTRGGRAGRRQVAHRFNSLIAGDWGALVELWLKVYMQLTVTWECSGVKINQKIT